MLNMISMGADITADDIDIDLIRTDGETQMRAKLNEESVANYAEKMKNGVKFPPVDLYYDGGQYWIGDGFHRIAAHKLAYADASTLPPIAANVRSGSRRKAILHAVSANDDHGLPRTNADKRRSVETLLMDDEWAKWSDRAIADACKVTHPLVAKTRKELTGNGFQLATERTYTTKHGTTATMSTAGIASANQERKQPQPAPVSKPPEISTVQDLVTETVLRQLHGNLLSARPYIAEAIGQTEKLGHSAWMVQALYLIDMEIKRVEENSNGY